MRIYQYTVNTPHWTSYTDLKTMYIFELFQFGSLWPIGLFALQFAKDRERSTLGFYPWCETEIKSCHVIR